MQIYPAWEIIMGETWISDLSQGHFLHHTVTVLSVLVTSHGELLTQSAHTAFS